MAPAPRSEVHEGGSDGRSDSREEERPRRRRGSGSTVDSSTGSAMTTAGTSTGASNANPSPSSAAAVAPPRPAAGLSDWVSASLREGMHHFQVATLAIFHANQMDLARAAVGW